MGKVLGPCLEQVHSETFEASEPPMVENICAPHVVELTIGELGVKEHAAHRWCPNLQTCVTATCIGALDTYP